MNKIITILVLSLLTAEITIAQNTYFATRGIISYDKITYTKARMRDMQQQMNQNLSGRGGGSFNLDNVPESSTEKYVLEFDENSTLMFVDPATNETKNQTQGMQMRGSRAGGGQMRGQNRGQGGAISIRNPRPDNSSKILSQNLKNSTTEVQVQVDDKYIITDSLNNITWRFSDEYRNIAGYECRRVNGATNDSLYLIAFYTDEIPLSAGPALTSGLPGMILGLVIPEMHIQYWATKVDYTNTLVKKDWKEKKAITINLDEFINSFGVYFQRGRDKNSSKRQVQEQLIY